MSRPVLVYLMAPGSLGSTADAIRGTLGDLLNQTPQYRHLPRVPTVGIVGRPDRATQLYDAQFVGSRGGIYMDTGLYSQLAVKSYPMPKEPSMLVLFSGFF